MRRLGEDEHGVWLSVPPGTVVRRGYEPPRVLDTGFISLVPMGSWWEVEFYPDHPRHEVYVNIGTPCEWHGDVVRQVDLDLDVVRNLDGSVELLDTLDRYSHALPTLQARAMARLDTVLGRAARRRSARSADAVEAGASGPDKGPDKGPNRRAAGTKEPDPSVDRADEGEIGTAYRIPGETSHVSQPRSPSTSKRRMRRMRQDR
jgi:Protein of unknown function (DUF402)